MAFFMVTYMVKRILETDYHPETFTCDGLYQTEQQVINKLKNDKNVVDFYKYRLFL